MSFPRDSAEDLAAINEVAGMLEGLAGTREFESPTNCGLKLVVDRNFPANMLYYFLAGDYEESDLGLIRRHVQPGDKVLELGGGVGLTGALVGQVSGMAVTICEPNPALPPLIRRTFAANGQQLNLIEAAAVNEALGDGYISFNVAPGYWWSSLLPIKDSSSLPVRSFRLSHLLELSSANVLLVDIEGYESQLFEGTDLQSVDTLIMEIHAPSLGAQTSCNLITSIIRRGFDLVDFAAQSFVFKRTQSVVVY
ncbi:hypothetical protein D3C78_466810 [compost metagenome]|jgi:FkbM family methyltransferase